MKKQPTFRPIRDEEVMAKKLRQGEFWEWSSRDETGCKAGGAEVKINYSQPGQGKDSGGKDQGERMARAKSLAADPNYPTEAIIQDLADMLARHWYSSPSSPY